MNSIVAWPQVLQLMDHVIEFILDFGNSHADGGEQIDDHQELPMADGPIPTADNPAEQKKHVAPRFFLARRDFDRIRLRKDHRLTYCHPGNRRRFPPRSCGVLRGLRPSGPFSS